MTLPPTVEGAIALLGLKITPDRFREIFRIPGPALISFSGGRTSALMLWCIWVAYDGCIPAGIVVAFANTGKENERTLRFVHECGSRWGIQIHWCEMADWSGRQTKPGDRFTEVGFNSASRNGEPFAAIIAKKGYLPNAVTRFCTTKLKVEVLKNLMMSLGHKHWLNAVGLRRDEGLRILKGIARNEAGRERWTTCWPLDRAGITKAVVMGFWLGPKAAWPSEDRPQGFDLELAPWQGNCDDCFLKGADVIIYQEQVAPGTADWWIEQERLVTAARRSRPSGARWVTEYSYERLQHIARTQADLFLEPPAFELDGDCSDICAGVAA